MSTDTRRRLMDGAMEVLRTHGIAGVSARSIAAAADVNQALVFYHFGTIDQLLDAACREDAELRVGAYRDRFDRVGSTRDLIALARAVHAEETARGNVTVMTQVLAGARYDERLAPAARYALDQWLGEIRPTLARLLEGSPVAELVDVASLTRTVAAAFLGVELYAGVDPGIADEALGALEQIAVLLDVVDDLGAPARMALRRRVRKAKRGG